MVWSMREIFIFLSISLLFCSCNSIKSETNENNKSFSKTSIANEEARNEFFHQVINSSSNSIELIDSLGFEIARSSDSLSYIPYHNSYEDRAFVFYASDRTAFTVFERVPLLEKDKLLNDSLYSVFRKDRNGKKLLDISIEPHPVLKWVFVIRMRSQE